MKKAVSLILALLLIFLAVPVQADGPLDRYSNEELQTLSTMIQAEIYARMGDGFQLYPGEYIVGEDILAGKYRVETVKGYGIVSVYKTDGHLYLSEFMDATDPDNVSVIGKMTLETGMKVVIDTTVFKFVPYTGIMP